MCLKVTLHVYIPLFKEIEINLFHGEYSPLGATSNQHCHECRQLNHIQVTEGMLFLSKLFYYIRPLLFPFLLPFGVKVKSKGCFNLPFLGPAFSSYPFYFSMVLKVVILNSTGLVVSKHLSVSGDPMMNTLHICWLRKVDMLNTSSRLKM